VRRDGDALTVPSSSLCSWLSVVPRGIRIPAMVLPPALLLAALVTACAPPQAPAERVPQVRSEDVAARTFSQSVSGIATLEALQEVSLAAQAGGRIERLLVRQGDRVRRGQLLLVLDQAQARADVVRLRSEMETNLLNYRRFEVLVRQGAATPFQRDDFRQRYVAAREELTARRADLAFRDLRAPIDGTVADLKVKQGDLIQAGAPFTSIIRNDRLLARMEVPAVYSAAIRPGLPLQLLQPSSARPLGQAPVLTVDPGVDPVSQTLLVKAEFPNPNEALRDGLRTRARLVLEDRPYPAVPFAAVSRQWGQSFVFVLGDLEALRRRPGRSDLARAARLPRQTRFALQTPVQLGPLQGGWYPVLKGLDDGAEVITSNLQGLRHGQPVGGLSR
jgi:RND family efflux transporter MFP subunit